MAFGRGPAGNDAKVNLGIFQPVELIKILLVMFLAGYFTRNWERLRDLREERLPGGRIARAEHVLPVLVATGIAIMLFFVLKDLGPALVTLFVFLAMFTVARGRPVLAIAAIVLMVAAVTVGYRAGTPHTVVQRIDMWLSPWDNDVHGGDQLAHALWAFATGGPTGSGPGWGDPGVIPAGNTDLVLPAIGEEWGFAGVASILVLFACPDLARPTRGPTGRHDIWALSGNRTLHPHRLRDAADHRRRAGSAAALRCGVAVSQFGQHRDGGEFPGVRAAGKHRQYRRANAAGKPASAGRAPEVRAGRRRRHPAGFRPALSGAAR